MARLTRRLAEYESDTLLALELRSAGTYDIESLIEGNSILSTVFVSSISVGGKVSAFYWDETTGEESGEFYQLASHKDVIANNTIDRLTVTRIHNKPRLRVIVTGSATFSVYITVVNSFASDLDAALKYEDEVVDFNQDKGIPIAGIDQATNTFHLLRTNNGNLQVELAGGGILVPINKRLYDIKSGILTGIWTNTISYTVPAGFRFILLSGHGSADTFTKWRMFINSVQFLAKRNAFDAPTVDLNLGSSMILVENDTLEVEVQNINAWDHLAEIETIILGRIEPI